MGIRTLIATAAVLAIVTPPSPTSSLPSWGSAVTQSRWTYPLQDNVSPVAWFNPPQSQWGSGHRGIDFRSDTQDAVVAPTNGVVHYVGRISDKDVISIRVDDHLIVSFEPVLSNLSVGDDVAKGSRIGSVSSGGHCQTSCLHVGVRLHGEYVNPLRFFAPKPRLLPLRKDLHALG